MLDEGGELSYGFDQNKMQHRKLAFDMFEKMVAENKGSRRIILDERRFNRFKDRLPEPAVMKDNGNDGYLMAIYQ